MKRDERIIKLAENVVDYSLGVQKGERIYVECFGVSAQPLFEEVIAAVTRAGGVPFYYCNDNAFIRDFLRDADEAQIKAYAAMHRKLMENCAGYIGIRGFDDVFALAELPAEKNMLWAKYFWETVHTRVRLNKRWCVMRYPNVTMAAMSKMSLKEFEDFYFEACLLDYRAMGTAMTALQELMEKTDRVKIIAPDTHLEFSIKGIPSIKSEGKRNIPDGEVDTAPVKDSINGYVQFNTDTIYRGTVFSRIRLEFVDGKIVKAFSQLNNDLLQQILDTDDGSRYIGEFALGVNTRITHPILDILFDEKIGGSFHMAIGNAYEHAFNGNRSANHWDLIQMQDAAHGGGEIWFDEVLIRKNGLFLPPELACLNPQK